MKNKLHQNKFSSDEIDKKMIQRVQLSKRKIENILIERNGYYPRKVFQSTIRKEMIKLDNIQQVLRQNPSQLDW